MDAGLIFVQADLGAPDAPEHLIDVTDQEFGRLDVLVNAAGDTQRERSRKPAQSSSIT